MSNKSLSPGELAWVSIRKHDRFQLALIVSVRPVRVGHYGCEERVTVLCDLQLNNLCDCEVILLDRVAL